jgi:hypothetical protein
MTAPALLESLKERGATVSADGDRLKLAAPPGVLKPRVLESLARHKAEILQLLEIERRSRASEPAPIARAGSTPDEGRKAERIARLAALVTPAEERAAFKTIKPMLKKQMSAADLRELALTLAYGAKQTEPTNRTAREVLTRDLYQPNQSANGS